MTTRLPLTVARDGVRLAVRLAPKASAERILGLAPDGAGGMALKVAVTAAPEAGKANEALLALLARLLHLKRRDLTLAQGATSRRKLVHVAGNPAALAGQIEEGLRPWLEPG